ncbi:hypothetical protein [Criblamydia sequanensis]|uniref:Conserved putative membrane protein n=1 Tax=Candidatus Criblamydia sequanensis CRIB-18 TaxID=1437425 RepID=A0A090E099_9BACT|nr:hypothetical protein [Criblamydia sequanensis]CDR34239.1 Conserved putative membrane protein [Criblamydia sequanensis CRIB-18]
MANPPLINTARPLWDDDDTWYIVNPTVFGNKLNAPSESNVPKIASVASASLFNKDTSENIEKKDQGVSSCAKTSLSNSRSLSQAVSKASNFIEFGAIVKKAKEDISFFGGRHIYVEGYAGSVDIEILAARTIALIVGNYEFTEEERVIGKEIKPIIDTLFKNNYSRKVTNLLTRVCLAVRDFFRNVAIIFGGLFCGSIGLRYCWMYGNERDSFKYYTISQYHKVFGKTPSTLPDMMRYNRPDRWFVK